MSADWKTYRLGDLVKLSSGGTPSKSKKEYWGGDIPWISASSMGTTRFGDSELKVTELGSQNGTRMVPKNTVLLLVRGGALHNKIPVGITTRAVTFNQDVKALIPKSDKITSFYLLYWLVSKTKKLLQKVESTGIGAGKLDTKVLEDLEVPVPSKDEMMRLELFCYSIDEKIIINRQTNQTLEQIAQAIFKSWFVDFEPTRAKIAAKQQWLAQNETIETSSPVCYAEQFDDHNNSLSLGERAGVRESSLEHAMTQAAMAAISGKTIEELKQLSDEKLKQLKETAALFPDALVESELGEIPVGWGIEPLSDQVNIKHGYGFKGEFFSDEPTSDILLTPGNFKVGGGFKFDKLKYYDGPIPEEFILEKNDLLVTMTDLSKQSDTLGFPALVPKVGEFKFLHNQRLGKLVSKGAKLNKYFLYSLFKSHRYRGEIVGSATGTTVKHTAPKKILAFTYARSAGLEAIFDRLARSLYNKVESNLNENEVLNSSRDTLLPKLLSGELEAVKAA